MVIAITSPCKSQTSGAATPVAGRDQTGGVVEVRNQAKAASCACSGASGSRLGGVTSWTMQVKAIRRVAKTSGGSRRGAGGEQLAQAAGLGDGQEGPAEVLGRGCVGVLLDAVPAVDHDDRTRGGLRLTGEHLTSLGSHASD